MRIKSLILLNICYCVVNNMLPVHAHRGTFFFKYKYKYVLIENLHHTNK